MNHYTPIMFPSHPLPCETIAPADLICHQRPYQIHIETHFPLSTEARRHLVLSERLMCDSLPQFGISVIPSHATKPWEVAAPFPEGKGFQTVGAKACLPALLYLEPSP